jgi:hypothetical protein
LLLTVVQDRNSMSEMRARPIAKDVVPAGRRRDRLSNPDAKNPKARNAAPWEWSEMEVAQKLPGVGRQSQNLSLSGELDRTRTALASSVSRPTERIGAIYSPTMRREGRSHFILRQRSVETSCRGSNFGQQPRERPIPGRFECRRLGIYWRDREKYRPCFQWGEG